MEDKNRKQAKEAIREYLEEIEVKLIQAYLKGKVDGIEIARKIYEK